MSERARARTIAGVTAAVSAVTVAALLLGLSFGGRVTVSGTPGAGSGRVDLLLSHGVASTALVALAASAAPGGATGRAPHAARTPHRARPRHPGRSARRRVISSRPLIATRVGVHVGPVQRSLSLSVGSSGGDGEEVSVHTAAADASVHAGIDPDRTATKTATRVDGPLRCPAGC